MQTMIFISDDELSKEGSMGAMNSQVSNPPLAEEMLGLLIVKVYVWGS